MREHVRVHPLVALACVFGLACSGGDGGGSVEPPAVASVSVTPPQVSVQVGATMQLSAEARAANGSVLAGRTFAWTSGNPGIASVTAAGVVRGESAGSTTVTATSGGRSGTANVTVTPPPVVSVSVTPNPGAVTIGANVQLTAEARDAGGAPIPGKTFTWNSSNTGVATVDGTGRVTGVAEGASTISATVDNVMGTATVNVSTQQPVIVTQISPATLVEGQPATITGSGFGASPAANTVMIDGVTATVAQASTTSLQITVPSFDCRPKRVAPVQVTVGVLSSTPAPHAVSPASFLTLAVGQQALVQGGEPRCLQFDQTAGAERYVVGVQSVSEVVSTLTPVTVNGALPAGAPAAVALPSLEVALSAPPHRLLSSVERERADAWRHHIGRTVDLYERERVQLQPIADRGGALMAAGSASVPTVPGTVQEGDELTVRFPAFDGNTCTEFTDITVRVREITARGIFVEDTSNPTQLAQSVFDQAGADFTTIYDIDVDQFGAPSDVDANQRVVIVFTREVNRLTSPPLAFVSHANLFPVTQCPASNEGEFFYMLAADPTGQFNAGEYTVTDLTDDLPHLLAHEFAHIVQGSRRVAAGGQFMVSWLAEALATAAQEVAGFQLLGLQNGANYGRSTIYPTLGGDRRFFFGYMNDLLAYFGFDFEGNRVAGAPEECSWVGSTVANGNPGPCSFSTRLLYGVPWSLIKYIIDRHLGGPAGQTQILRAFSDHVGPPGFADLESVLGRPIASMMAEWAPMLHIDDRYPVAAFQLANWNIRDIAAAWQTPNSELAPRARGFSDFSDAFNLRGGSTAYYEISGSNRPATALGFRDGTGAALPQFVNVWVVRVQ